MLIAAEDVHSRWRSKRSAVLHVHLEIDRSKRDQCASGSRKSGGSSESDRSWSDESFSVRLLTRSLRKRLPQQTSCSLRHRQALSHPHHYWRMVMAWMVSVSQTQR